MEDEFLFTKSDPKWRHLVGQRIEFKSRDRETGKTKSWVGEVEFIGANELHGKFQITVGRCPVWPVIVSSIKRL